MSDSLDEIAARIKELDVIIKSAHDVYYGLPGDASASERESAQRAYVDPQIERNELQRRFDSLRPR